MESNNKTTQSNRVRIVCGGENLDLKDKLSIQDIVLIGLFMSLITVCSFIRIPFGAVPFTLQTLGVFVTTGLLGTKRGFIAVVVYILMGTAGLPVFGGAGGPAVILGATGGYITGFMLSVGIIGFISIGGRKLSGVTRYTINGVAMLLGDMACMAFGTIQFILITNTSWIVALGYCVFPFVVPEILKIVVAVGLVEAVRKADRGKTLQ